MIEYIRDAGINVVITLDFNDQDAIEPADGSQLESRILLPTS